MRYLAVFGASLALLSAQPALAGISKAAFDCPAANAPAGLAASLADVIIKGDENSPEVPKVFEALRTLTDTCIAKTGVKPDQAEAYAGYTFDVLLHRELGKRLTAKGVPVEAIDEGLGFGPGRPNLPVGEIQDSHVEKISAAMRVRGYDLAKAPDEVHRLIGMYIGALSGLAEDRAKLN
ncbi:MAG TPA: hypothetical protein VFV30_00820 [Novosphingobium sp.]|nr:hypothetical protein [Novosphingobium sp.]